LQPADDPRTLRHFDIVAVEPLLAALNSLLIVIAHHLFRGPAILLPSVSV
jgi:hypothetical protein